MSVSVESYAIRPDFIHMNAVEVCAPGGEPKAVKSASEFDDLTMLRAGGISKLPLSASTLSQYLERIQKVAVCSAEEQQELARLYIEEQDSRAGQLLILSNLRLVVRIAKQHVRQWSELLDLIQEGNVGLAEAVTRYNPYRGVKFTSYAQYWVRAMILNYLMNQLYPVKLGSSRSGRKLFYNLKKARRTLLKQGYTNLTTELVAEYLEVNEEDVVAIAAQLDGPPLFLDAPLPGDDASSTYGDMMPTSEPSPEDLAAQLEFWEHFRTALHCFGEEIRDDRRRAIWYERVTLNEPKHLAVLGDEWGLSKERIRQIEMEIRDEFKHYLIRQLGAESIQEHFDYH